MTTLLPLWKNKRLYWSLFLFLIISFFLGFYIYVQYFKIPNIQKVSKNIQKEIQNLEEEKEKLYKAKAIENIMNEYEKQAAILKSFETRRQEVFSFGEDSLYDFFPPLTEVIFPIITQHLHNDVHLEALSLNEQAELVLSLYSRSYTQMAKQYLALKESFDRNNPLLFSDIQLNTLTRQEIDIFDRDEYGKLNKNREKVVKATIIAHINPDFFSQKQELPQAHQEM